MRDLADQLRQLGHVAGWIAPEHTDVFGVLKGLDGEIVYASQSRRGSPRDWWRLRKSLRSWAPDVIILNDTHAVTLAGWARWWQRGNAPIRLAYKHTIFPLRSALKYRLLSDKVVCVSQAAQEIVVAGGLRREHTTVVPGGCPLPTVDSSRVEVLRKQICGEQGKQLVIAVGSLIEIKGHSDLLGAFANQSRKDLVLAIAGAGPMLSNLQEQAKALNITNRVKFLGYREDVNELIAAADLVVHPSHSEGLSLVLIQAKMLAKPIVATPVGGAKEVLLAGAEEQLGYWPSVPGDIPSMEVAMRSALSIIAERDDLLPAALERSRDAAEQEYSIRQSAERLANLAHELRQKQKSGKFGI